MAGDPAETPRRPFIYIAALPRSGSTLLGEMLTDFPRSFILREPRAGEGHFDVKPAEIELLRSVGVDLDDFRRRHTAWWRRRRLPRAIRDRLIPALPPEMEQLGVKEITHAGWRRYADAFPEMRIIVLGRDPRDVYLSMHDVRRRGIGRFKDRDLTPAAAAALLSAEFERQRAMLARCRAMRVTYERLCTDPDVAAEIRGFVRSPLAESGRAGQFTATTDWRRDEAELHGGSVSSRRIARWRREADTRLVDQAHEVLERMPAYAAFWGYIPAGAHQSAEAS